MAATRSNRWYLRGAIGFTVLGISAAIAYVAFTTSCARPLRHPELAATDADYLGTDLGSAPAPAFTLTDQRGAAVGLSDFKGKVVVLGFLDPDCTDSCPLTAAQFRWAAQTLLDHSDDVVFLAVNVNPHVASVDAVREATDKWGNSRLLNWYFLTGSEQKLRPVWDAYHIAAEAGPKPGKPDEQLHSTSVYIIDQEGRERWIVSVPLYAGATWQGRSLGQILVERLQQLWR